MSLLFSSKGTTHCVAAVLQVKKDVLCTACVQSLLECCRRTLDTSSHGTVVSVLPSGNCGYSVLSPKWCQVVILESTGWHRQKHGRGSADNKTVQAVARQCVILHLGPDLFGTNNSGNVTASISVYEAHELSGIFCSQVSKIKGPCFLQAMTVELDKGRRQFPRSCKQTHLSFIWLTKVQIKKTWPSLLRTR